MLLTPIMYPIPAEECRLLLLGTGRKLFPSSLRLLLLAELTREVVEMLLKAGADTSTVDSLGYTALFEAVRKGNDGCISLMLKYNAKWVLLWYEGIKCEVGCVKNLLGLVAVGKVELAGELQSGVDHSWVEISPLHNCVGRGVSHKWPIHLPSHHFQGLGMPEALDSCGGRLGLLRPGWAHPAVLGCVRGAA
eukprot:1147877-Pelagomonas_calceolata.AAC.2